MRIIHSIYEFNSPVEFLKWNIEQNTHIHRYKSLLAEAAKCKLSYLSQVIGGKAALTADHAIGLGDFWNLDPFEKKYFLELVYFSKASTEKLREHIQKRLEEIKTEGKDQSVKISYLETQVTESQDYFSTWYVSAIHMLLTLPNYNKEELIAERLKLTIPQVRKALLILVKLSLIKKENEGWTVVKEDVHVSKHSPLYGLNHMLWRQKAIEAVNEGREVLAYTEVHTMSKEAADTLKEMVNAFVKKARELTVNSAKEEIVCLNCDLFTLE